jgi:hypothetical protein
MILQRSCSEPCQWRLMTRSLWCQPEQQQQQGGLSLSRGHCVSQLESLFLEWAQSKPKPVIGPKWALEGFPENQKLRYRFWTRNNCFLYNIGFPMIEESEKTNFFWYRNTKRKECLIWVFEMLGIPIWWIGMEETASTNILSTFCHMLTDNFAQDPFFNKCQRKKSVWKMRKESRQNEKSDSSSFAELF